MSEEYELVKVNGDTSLELKVRKKKKVPYNEIIKLLIEGYTVFIPEMNRRTASYVRRRLSEILETEVKAYPSILNNVHGYAFKISILDEIIERLGDT